MSRPDKKKDDSASYDEYADLDNFTDDPLQSPKDDFNFNDNYGNQGESVIEKPTIDKFYDTENILYSLEKTFRGFQKKEGKWVYITRPIARDEFINLTINSLRSVINPENIISKKSAEEVEIILLENRDVIKKTIPIDNVADYTTMRRFLDKIGKLQVE